MLPEPLQAPRHEVSRNEIRRLKEKGRPKGRPFPVIFCRGRQELPGYAGPASPGVNFSATPFMQ
jgi:hypothetical protein